MGILLKVKEIKSKDEYVITSGPRTGKTLYGQYMTAIDEARREYPVKVNSIVPDKWKVGDKFEGTITDRVFLHDGENYNQTKAALPGSDFSGQKSSASSSGNGHAAPRAPRMSDIGALAALTTAKFDAAVALVMRCLRQKDGSRISLTLATAKVRDDLSVGNHYLEWASGIGTTVFLGIQRGEIISTESSHEPPPSDADDSSIPF